MLAHERQIYTSGSNKMSSKWLLTLRCVAQKWNMTDAEAKEKFKHLAIKVKCGNRYYDRYPYLECRAACGLPPKPQITITGDAERGIPAGREMTQEEMIEYNRRCPFNRDVLARFLTAFEQKLNERTS